MSTRRFASQKCLDRVFKGCSREWQIMCIAQRRGTTTTNDAEPTGQEDGGQPGCRGMSWTSLSEGYTCGIQSEDGGAADGRRWPHERATTGCRSRGGRFGAAFP